MTSLARYSVAFIAAFVLLPGGVVAVPEDGSAKLAPTMLPNADGYVDAVYPERSFGHASALRVSRPPVRIGFLSFSSRSLTERAVLRFWVGAGASGWIAIAPATGSYSESRSTFASRAAALPAPRVHLRLRRNAWNTVDVTSLLVRSPTHTLALLPLGASTAVIATREGRTHRPRLILTEAGQETVPATTPSTTTLQGSPSPIIPSSGPSDALLTAAGDIASCDGAQGADALTAVLLGRIPGVIAPLGDTNYGDNSPAGFARCYGATWGAFLARTRPAVGNHDYDFQHALGYFDYFGAAAGDPNRGYYSYELGAWHIIVLNSECWALAGGCRKGGPEELWLRQDLAAHPALCTLAYWHEPLFSSGAWHSPASAVFWEDLYAAGADVVLNGHEHFYERFVKLDPQGFPDPARGIVEFIVGTGGRGHFSFVGAATGSAVKDNSSFGVLTLALRPSSYEWRFNPVGGGTFTDSGSDQCH